MERGCDFITRDLATFLHPTTGLRTSVCAEPLGCRIRLEVKATAELNGARGTGVVAEGEAVDVSKYSAGRSYGYVGIADELRVVKQIECFDTNLELGFTVYLEAASDTCVYVGNAGSAEFVAASVAKVWRDHARGHRTIYVTGRAGVGVLGLDGIGEGCGVEPGVTARDGTVPDGASMAAKLMVRSDELGILVCARCVDS
jgi:hypothetical protein